MEASRSKDRASQSTSEKEKKERKKKEPLYQQWHEGGY
jgi:hypothetical protein